MKKFPLGLLVGLLFAFGVSFAAPLRVGVGKVPTVKVFAASSTSSGSLTVDWSQFTVNRDGSGSWSLAYTSSTGQQVGRMLRVDAACTQVVDQLGNVVYTTTGAGDAVCTTLSGAVTRSTALLAACASGGKCNL